MFGCFCASCTGYWKHYLCPTKRSSTLTTDKKEVLSGAAAFALLFNLEKHSFCLSVVSLPLCFTHTHTQTYAVELCMSCQPLLKLFLRSFRGLMPSFCLSSACCFSLDNKTCLSVFISSSSWTHTQKDKELLYLSFYRLPTSNISSKWAFIHVWAYFHEFLLNFLSLLLCHDRVVRVDIWCQVFISLSERLRVQKTCKK